MDTIKVNKLTPSQMGHAHMISGEFSRLMYDKYEKGAAEHGGNLWDNKPEWLLDQALDEAIDQVVYLLTLKEQMHDLVEKAWMYDDLQD